MAPAATAASKPKTAAPRPAKALTADVDLVRSYLRDIGRVPLLTHEQEITLGRQVQELMDLESLESELESKAGEKPSRTSWPRPQGFHPCSSSASCSTAVAPRSGWWRPISGWW